MENMKKTKLLAMFFIAGLLASCSTGSSVVSDDNGVRQVGNVRWHKKKSVDAHQVANQNKPANSAGVFFLRPADDDGLQTSANVAINRRFQVSLQPGNFSQVYSCSGLNDLSVEVTGRKTNDLHASVLSRQFEIGKDYYFSVDVSPTGDASIRPLATDIAVNAMKGMTQQTHQISRVVPNCPEMPARIELKVLFDTDKSLVKKQYYSEIQRVASYMSKYPSSTAVIEGHTDSRAGTQYNINLSQRRVNAVKTVLVKRYGVDASRIKAVGYGESRPIATNATAKGRQQNRRVIAVFSN